MRGRRDEGGQAMAEFALVLPMLAMLTFGTIEVTLWLQQQSALNAAAFMAARSASVLGGDLAKTRQALQSYGDASPSWLKDAIGSMKPRAGVRGKETAGFELEARGDRFSGLIAALTAGTDHPVNAFDTLASGATLPMEYTPKRHKGNLTGEKPRFLFDYRVEATEKAVAPASVAKVKTTAERVITEAKTLITAIANLQPPQPAPSAAPPTPKPKGSGAPPVSKPTKPPVDPQVGIIADLKKKIPAIEALTPQGEMFNTAGAVIENPSGHGKPDPTKIQSLTYLGPKFERVAKGEMPSRVKFCAEVHIEHLDGAREDLKTDKPSKLTLQKTCDGLRTLLDAAKASKIPAASGAAHTFEKNVKPLVERLDESFKQDYDRAVTREAGLFKGGRF